MSWLGGILEQATHALESLDQGAKEKLQVHEEPKPLRGSSSRSELKPATKRPVGSDWSKSRENRNEERRAKAAERERARRENKEQRRVQALSEATPQATTVSNTRIPVPADTKGDAISDFGDEDDWFQPAAAQPATMPNTHKSRRDVRGSPNPQAKEKASPRVTKQKASAQSYDEYEFHVPAQDAQANAPAEPADAMSDWGQADQNWDNQPEGVGAYAEHMEESYTDERQAHQDHTTPTPDKRLQQMDALGYQDRQAMSQAYRDVTSTGDGENQGYGMGENQGYGMGETQGYGMGENQGYGMGEDYGDVQGDAMYDEDKAVQTKDTDSAQTTAYNSGAPADNEEDGSDFLNGWADQTRDGDGQDADTYSSGLPLPNEEIEAGFDEDINTESSAEAHGTTPADDCVEEAVEGAQMARDEPEAEESPDQWGASDSYTGSGFDPTGDGGDGISVYGEMPMDVGQDQQARDSQETADGSDDASGHAESVNDALDRPLQRVDGEMNHVNTKDQTGSQDSLQDAYAEDVHSNPVSNSVSNSVGYVDETESIAYKAQRSRGDTPQALSDEGWEQIERVATSSSEQGELIGLSDATPDDPEGEVFDRPFVSEESIASVDGAEDGSAVLSVRVEATQSETMDKDARGHAVAEAMDGSQFNGASSDAQEVGSAPEGFDTYTDGHPQNEYTRAPVAEDDCQDDRVRHEDATAHGENSLQDRTIRVQERMSGDINQHQDYTPQEVNDYDGSGADFGEEDFPIAKETSEVASENQRSEDEVEHDINSQYTSHDDGAEREYKSPVDTEEYIALQEEFTLLSEAQNDLQQDFELLSESQNTLVAEHDELQKYATQLETELDEFKEQNAEVGKRWAAYEAKHTAVNAELAAAQKQVETYLKSTTELREKLATAEAQEQTKTSQVQALQIELKSLNDELTTLDEEKGRLLTQAANMSGENSSVKEAMKAEVESMKLALEAEEKKAVEAHNEVVMLQLKLESEAQEATTEMGSLHYQVENLQVSIKDADRANRTIQREREEIQKQFEEYKKRAGKILQEKDVLIGQMKFGGAGGDLSSSGTGSTVDAQRDMEALRSELLQSQIQIKELRFELKNVEEQHERDMEVQADTVDELESELSAMRTQMHQMESRHLNTIEEYKNSLAEANAAKSTLAQQLQTQQSETAQMQASFTAAEPRTEALVELEARMNNLTDQLINQQQVVESLTTANATLSLQLESEKNKYTRDVTRRQEEDEANSRKINKDLERMIVANNPKTPVFCSFTILNLIYKHN